MKWVLRYSERRKLSLFFASAVAALLLGFLLIAPGTGAWLIGLGGYYYILLVFATWMYFACRVFAPFYADFVAGGRNSIWVVVFLVTATVLTSWTDKFGHKLLFDDHVLQGTAWHMHATKEIATPIRAYELEGTWININTFLDKRPYFFTFLLSLIHDFAGFRLSNVFALNISLAFVVLASVFWIVKTMTERAVPAYLSVLLLATLPLFGQNATGASMEVLNLAMIGILIAASVLYLQEPGDDRLSFLLFGAILLAQARYESVLFVFPISAVIVLGWFMRSRVILPWTAIAAPLLFVPYAWHDRFVDANQYLWQLREGEQSRFALHYLPGNLKGAWNFLFSTSPTQPTSLYLVVLGTAGLVWAGFLVWRLRCNAAQKSWQPVSITILLFGLTIVANLSLLMFYYWSRLDEPLSARFALPLFMILSVVAGWFVHSLESRGLPALRYAALAALAWFVAFAVPAFAGRLYTTQNLVKHEIEWEIEQVTRRPGPILLITASAPVSFLLQKVPVLNTNLAPHRAGEIRWHMDVGTFREVLVSQLISPTSAEFEPAVHPDSELPESFKLETLSVKRFGMRWIRISRLTSIELPERELAGQPTFTTGKSALFVQH